MPPELSPRVTPVMAAPSTTSKSIPPNTSSNILFHLPVELPQIIFSYLGYPVGGHIWIDGDDYPYRRKAVRHKFWKCPTRAHEDEGNIEVRHKIAKVQFDDCYPSKGMSAHVELKPRQLYRTRIMEPSLLRVNKELRTELMDLLFGANDVEFYGPLTDDTAFQFDDGPPPRYRIEPRCLVLLPSTLTHMTSIILLGSCLGHTGREDAWKEDCQSLRFLAKHAINMRCLTYSTWEGSCYRMSTEGIMALVQTIREVTVTAKKLKRVRLLWTSRFGYSKKEWEKEIMVLDKPKWGAVVLEVWQILDGLRDEEETRSERYEAEIAMEYFRILPRSRRRL